VLRAFAASGRPPTISALYAVTAGSAHATADVLAALHELDAVRLGPDRGVAVASCSPPFRPGTGCAVGIRNHRKGTLLRRRLPAYAADVHQ
jgi:hypothetical protein